MKQEISERPDAFMRMEDLYARDRGMRDRDAGGPGRDDYARDSSMRDRDAGGQDRDDSRGDVASFDRFLDGHREIAEQIRRDPSLYDNRDFVQNHPALEAFLQDNPGVRDRLRADPRAFMQQDNGWDQHNSWDQRDRDPRHDRMADFGGFLGSHSDIQRDLSRDPAVVKDPGYVQNHTELNAYLSSHPDVRSGLMADPRGFVEGAQQFSNAFPFAAWTAEDFWFGAVTAGRMKRPLGGEFLEERRRHEHQEYGRRFARSHFGHSVKRARQKEEGR